MTGAALIDGFPVVQIGVPQFGMICVCIVLAGLLAALLFACDKDGNIRAK